MKLRIFQSDKGDCLLLSAGAGAAATHVLIDGGMRDSYRTHVAEAISKLPKLDLVYVSHIDQDHISGVLQMLDDAFDWLVFDKRTAKGQSHPKPQSFRPPPIRGIWHNAFRDQVDANDGNIAEFLIATSNIASAMDDKDWQQTAIAHSDLATSIPEAIQLSSRIGVKQLGLRVNQGKGKLLMARKGQKAISVGPMKFTILAPFEEDLNKLRDEWNAWLKVVENQKRVKSMRARAAADEKMAANSFDVVVGAMLAQAKTLGDRTAVTAPNLASIMVLVEENGKEVLLTGDGHSGDVLKGLETVGRIPVGGSLHVKVLKVQHHGSENNIDKAFCQRVSADHYVFCGNGAHTNPEVEVIDAIFDSRVGTDASPNAPKTKFKFWFNSHSSVTDPKNRKQMKAVESRVASLAKKSGGRFSFEFLKDSSFPPLTI